MLACSHVTAPWLFIFLGKCRLKSLFLGWVGLFWVGSRFSLFALSFNSLIQVCLGEHFLEFVLLGVHLAFWMYTVTLNQI